MSPARAMSSRFLHSSERSEILKRLRQESDRQGLPLDERHDEDPHLAYEALHVLADGLPDRLYEMLHPASLGSDSDGNPGRTFLALQRIAQHGSGAFDAPEA
ncbi:hypothetical protein [Thiomonas sp.]